MHTGGEDGWYRNIVFVPAFNELGRCEGEVVGDGPGRGLLRAFRVRAGAMGASEYPAALLYNGLTMFRYVDKPGRFSLDPSLSTVYHIGRPPDRRCLRRRLVPQGRHPWLVSGTSIGPADGTWLAGPQVDEGARALYKEVSCSYGCR